jgi:transcriptional regulator with XRE-family HTH domain
MNLKELGARIKEQRERRGLRQADIASALQISAQAVSKWERGENAPDISVLANLARFLDVTVEWLLGGTSAATDTFEACVFLTSLNGFAEKAASMRPKDVASWANGIYYTVTEALRRFDGVPVKCLGDGFLGFFTGRDPAGRALDAALQARNLHDHNEMVITLHHGEIYLGTMGHPDYARPDILGGTVNTAFLVMPWVAKHCLSGIGLTAPARDRLKGRRDVKKCGEVEVLGLSAPVIIYEPDMG